MDVLIVAFDGLDYELIKKYGCENLMDMQEFGQIDNDTNMNSRKTSELFASFITGKNYEEHGIKGLGMVKPSKSWSLIRLLSPDIVTNNVPGGFRWRQALMSLFNVRRLRPGKEFLKSKTIFDKIKNSKALFVPGYNPSPRWRIRGGFGPLNYGVTIEELESNREGEFMIRKSKLFEKLEKNKELLMCHFHHPDFIQHLHAYDNKVRDQKRIKRLYRRMDYLAYKINKKANGALIFMSDHGLPTNKSHNKKAFYSCNRELFGEQTPHITDFHDRILELVSDETAGLDI